MPKPLLQALLLADNVYQDKATGKKIIAGTFNQLSFRRQKALKPGDQPTQAPRQVPVDQVRTQGSPTAFVSLTDVKGPTELELRYVDLEDNRVIMGAKLQVVSDNPLQTVEAVIPLPPLPVPHSGVYALELLWDDEPLGMLRVTVTETELS